MNSRQFEETVLERMEQEHLLLPGDGVAVGVSGGADSVALLRFFCRIRERMSLSLLCVHVEHGLRGESSLSDQTFVRELCGRLDAPFAAVSLGERLRKGKNGKSSEEEARKLRYEALEAQAKRWEEKTGRRVRIAVAHHAEDNAETVLFHLARGCGLDGLQGIPIRRGRVIRPFLYQSRAEIEAYLSQLGQDYCTDASNADLAYDRNRIRHRVLPELQKINPQAVSHICKNALLIREMDADLRQRSAAVLAVAQIAPDEIGVQAWEGEPSLVRRETIRLWLEAFFPSRRDLSSAHLEAAAALEQKQVGSSVTLPDGWRIRRTYRGLKIQKEPKETPREGHCLLLAKADLDGGEETAADFGGKRLALRVFEAKEVRDFPRNAYTKWFDYDRIENDIAIRSRRPGDYLMIRGDGGRKKLQDYMVNEKIPQDLRDGILLLCDGSHVLWVTGYRISAYYKIRQTTEKILEVRILEEEDHE